MTLRARLSTLIGTRVVVSTALLGWAILIQINRPGSFPVDPFFFLIGITYALSVLYLAAQRVIERHPWLVDLQLAADVLLVSAFIHLTGGITSYFSSLYLLPIVAASMTRFGRGALQVATLSALMYLGLVSAQYLDPQWVPVLLRTPAWDDLPSLGFAQYTVAINLFGFLAVAWLSGSLAEGLRSAGAKLADASHQIEDLRAFNSYLVESLLSGLISTDSGCRILTFNKAASSITGLTPAQAIGGDAAELLQLPPQVRSRLASLGEGKSLRVDLTYRTADSRVIDLGLTASPMSFPDGRTGILFAFQDVTTMKRLERDSRMQQRLAAVGEMAAGIAHEIRNPLASMSGSIQVLRQELPLTEDQAQLMDIVLRESERLNHTIGSFLAYARPQRFAVARLDVRAVVEDTAALLRNSADVTSAHVIEVDVPEEPVWYEADGNQLRQVVWNLATNGIRAMATGGGLLLAVRGADGGGLSITVEDHGCGIPPEDLETIFQPFRSTFARGTGLGLATVHRIVTDYGGRVDVTSTVGSGTVVRVLLPGPAAAAGGDGDTPVPAERKTSGSTPDTSAADRTTPVAWSGAA